jgi:hypothetical protein
MYYGVDHTRYVDEMISPDPEVWEKEKQAKGVEAKRLLAA